MLSRRLTRERDACWSDAVQTQEGAIFNYFRELPASISQVLSMYRVRNFALINDPSSRSLSNGQSYSAYVRR